MWNRSIQRALISTALLGVAALASSCKSSDSDRASATVESLSSIESSLASAKQTVADVVQSLRDVEANAKTDPRPAYDKFSANLAKLDSISQTARERASALQTRAAAYHERWLQELSGIQDEDIREKSKERYDAAMKRFATLSERLGKLKEDYQPFVTRLHDVKTYLANDLNPKGIDNMEDAIDDAADDAKDVNKSIDRVASEISELRKSISAFQAAPQTATSEKK